MMDTSLHYTSVNHPTYLMSSMNKLRCRGQLCDVIIVTGGNLRIEAHRVVLAACSPYFGPLLEPSHTPAFNGLPVEIHLSDVDADCLEQIVDFCYTSSISVREENAWMLLPTAARLQMTELCTLCGDYLQSALRPDTCMQTFMAALRAGLTELSAQAQSILKEHLDEVLQSEGYLELTVVDMSEALHALPSSVLGHRDKVKAIRHWVNHRWDVRQHYASQLVHSFPGLISRLKEFLPEDLLQQQPLEMEDSSLPASPTTTTTTTTTTPGPSPPSTDDTPPRLSPSDSTRAFSPTPAGFRQVSPLALDVKARLSPHDARSPHDDADSDSDMKGLDLSMSRSLLREREDAASDSIHSEDTASFSSSTSPSSSSASLSSSPLCMVCGEIFHTFAQRALHQEDCANVLYKESGEILENGFPNSSAEPPLLPDCKSEGVVKRGDHHQQQQQHHHHQANVCQLCFKAFSDRKSLGKHMRTHSQSGFSCQVCQRRYSTRSHLMGHMRLHSGAHPPFPCEYCQRPFSSYCTLKVHMRGHKGSRPFSCPQCGQHFAKNIHLKRHLSTHSGVKPHKCGLCGKNFSRSDHLKRHEQSIHAGQRPHSCKVCGKAFVRKYELSKHLHLHVPRSSSAILPEASWDGHSFYGIGSSPGLVGLAIPEGMMPSERIEQR